MQEISLEISDELSEALRSLYPGLTTDEAAEQLVRDRLRARFNMNIKRARVVRLQQPNKG